jgi:hypothetical protein
MNFVIGFLYLMETRGIRLRSSAGKTVNRSASMRGVHGLLFMSKSPDACNRKIAVAKMPVKDFFLMKPDEWHLIWA